MKHPMASMGSTSTPSHSLDSTAPDPPSLDDHVGKEDYHCVDTQRSFPADHQIRLFGTEGDVNVSIALGCACYVPTHCSD